MGEASVTRQLDVQIAVGGIVLVLVFRLGVVDAQVNLVGAAHVERQLQGGGTQLRVGINHNAFEPVFGFVIHQPPGVLPKLPVQGIRRQAGRHIGIVDLPSLFSHLYPPGVWINVCVGRSNSADT